MATVVEALGALADTSDFEPPGATKTAQNGSFEVANGVDTRLVLERCGVEHDDKFARCPGCDEPGALLCAQGGLKCLHARCADAGPEGFPGFRSNVDLVAHCEALSARHAAERICEWFGLKYSRPVSVLAGGGGGAAEWARPLPLDDHRGGAG